MREDSRGDRAQADLILEAKMRRGRPPDLSGCKDCPRAAALRSWLRWLEAQLEEVRA